MELPINHNRPLIMHIDLNSCFATAAQQAFMHLRGKPLVVAAYATANGCVLSPSIEAKRYGIKTGMTVREARLLCKDIIVRTNDPPLVRDIHTKFKKIFKDYSPDVVPKSIDEAVIDFRSVENILTRSLEEIGREIKLRMRKEIGEWISCSIGIATNRFLAKIASSLIKPDGLVTITYQNVRDILGRLKFDLHGINQRFQARLNMVEIFTPVDFLDTPVITLKHQVFQSINGYYWYLRLRGYEIDDVIFARKSFGQDYALGQPTADPFQLLRLTMKLCEKMGRRLRGAGQAATGIHVALVYHDWSFWHRGRKVEREMYTTHDLFKKAIWLINQQPLRKIVKKLSVSCYGLFPSQKAQMNLFDADDKLRRISDAMDKINDRYGEFVITPALMMNMDDLILDRIAFGSVKELEDLYAS